MLITCWSVKGGSGTTVVASALALLLAQRHSRTCLVDLDGDSPACLGLPEPTGPGLGHWLDAPSRIGADALTHLTTPVNEFLRVLPAGDRSYPNPERWETLAGAIGTLGDTVIVDAGLGEPPEALRAAATIDLLVVRGCYLSMRRLAHTLHRPTGVVLVNEPGRVLRRPEVEAVSGVPVLAEIEWDPVVARSIDAGLLAGRIPRSLRDALEPLLPPRALRCTR